MLIVIGLMFLGVLLGYRFREREWKNLQGWISGAIFLLLFLLGIAVGANGDIMDNLESIGLEAFVITSAAVAGSVFCAWIVYKFFFHER